MKSSLMDNVAGSEQSLVINYVPLLQDFRRQMACFKNIENWKYWWNKSKFFIQLHCGQRGGHRHQKLHLAKKRYQKVLVLEVCWNFECCCWETPQRSSCSHFIHLKPGFWEVNTLCDRCSGQNWGSAHAGTPCAQIPSRNCILLPSIICQLLCRNQARAGRQVEFGDRGAGVWRSWKALRATLAQPDNQRKVCSSVEGKAKDAGTNCCLQPTLAGHWAQGAFGCHHSLNNN